MELTDEEKKELAEHLRTYARRLKAENEPIFQPQIDRLNRQADKLDPPMVTAPPPGDTAEVKGPCIHGA